MNADVLFFPTGSDSGMNRLPRLWLVQDVCCILKLIINMKERIHLFQSTPDHGWALFTCILSPWPVTMPPCPHAPWCRVRGMFPISLLPGRWKHVNWTSLTDNLIPDNFLYDSAVRVPAVLEPYIFSSCFGQNTIWCHSLVSICVMALLLADEITLTS